MQDFDWNDLKFLLALHRTNSFAGAARLTGVDETTVARRLSRLETALGQPLRLKSGARRYALSDAALVILDHAEAIEAQARSLQDRLGQLPRKIAGTVRISAVPYLINRILVPGLPTLQEAHPDLCIELIPETRNVDLTRREADLAVRFARPVSGGMHIKARKLGDMRFAAFCRATLSVSEAQQLNWIGYEDAHAPLPQARWIKAMCAKPGQRLGPLRVADLETAHQAVLRGQGKSILPAGIGQNDDRLCHIPLKENSFDMRRPVWLLSHSSRFSRPSHKVAKAWLSALHWT